MQPVLKVQGLHKTFKVRAGLFRTRSFCALKEISFCLGEGQTLAVIGETGSGKSTLGKILAGADISNSGQIILDNALVEDDGKRLINSKDVRLIFQDPMKSLNPSLTIGKILNEILQLNTELNELECKQKIDETLLKVGLLAEHRNYYAHMFSGGQIQRVALARAIILDPKVLVLDEALSSLDPSVRAQTVNLLLSLQKETGLSYVLITNHLSLVRHMSDSLLILHKGETVEYGVTSELFCHAKSKLGQRLLSC